MLSRFSMAKASAVNYHSSRLTMPCLTHTRPGHSPGKVGG